MKLKKQYLHLIIIIFLSVVVYANTFFNGFVFDDKFFIVDNLEIRSLKNIPSYFSEPSVGNLYRPLRSVLYSLTFFFWKFNPTGYHLNAILLHTLISILVYLIISEIVSNRRFSLIVSLLFLAHPAHTERVANMTAGFDLLGILFLFWAFYNYIIFRKHNSKRAFAYSLILFILGLFSSEEVIIFPVLALLYDFCFVEGKKIFDVGGIKNKIKYFWIYAASLLFYLAVRFSVLQQIGRADVYFLGDLQTRILSTSVIFLRYICILVWPLNLTVDYYVGVYKSFFSLNIILTLVVYMVILFLWVKLYNNYKIAFFSIGWFFITLMPFSNIFPVYLFMADRYLYVASFGFVVLLVYLLDAFFNIGLSDKNISKVIYAVVVLILIAAYSSITITRNSEWESDYTLLSKAVQRQPKSFTAHNDLGGVYQEKGFYDKAFDEYRKAIMLNNQNHIAWLNIGTLYGEVGNYSEAAYYIGYSLSIYESYKAHNNLGLIYSRMGEMGKAVAELTKAIEFDPSLSKAHMDLGIVYASNGNLNLALTEFGKALEINPHVADTHYNLAILYLALNQTNKSKTEFRTAYQLEPNNKLYKDAFLKSG